MPAIAQSLLYPNIYIFSMKARRWLLWAFEWTCSEVAPQPGPLLGAAPVYVAVSRFIHLAKGNHAEVQEDQSGAAGKAFADGVSKGSLSPHVALKLST